MTDGYQVYHTLEKEREDLIIAGCWVHARRRLMKHLPWFRKKAGKSLFIPDHKADPGNLPGGRKTQRTFLKGKTVQRQVVVKPLVDALFVYLKQHESEVGTEKLRAAFTYALNQEKYLRVFLTDGDVPMDNNASERAIRGFWSVRKTGR